MRILPYFAGAAVIVAIGGAVAGAAIDTTPRQIHDSPSVAPSGDIAFDDDVSKPVTANHYPLKTGGRTIEVAELRERGLYSQDRYARSYYVEADYGDHFDFEAADAQQRQWEEQQRVSMNRPRQYQRPSARRPLELQRPAQVAEAEVQFVSRPVVQDTSAMGQ